ncbi:site-specific integrase [Candidatus Gottesmanbacteria bacterium]|nr:site-specific integrase [Candidatus Gottesmanbacteria bacterium]
MPNLDEIISSNLAKYQDILELSFSQFLFERGASGKTQKNYISDINHFLSWTVLTIQAHNIPLPTTHTELINLITPHIMEQYKHFLLANHIPAATTNRRLSALRTFGAFCQSQGWWADNPANILINVPIEKRTADPTSELLQAFRADLAREGASKVTIKNYTSDIRQFLHWLSQQTTA